MNWKCHIPHLWEEGERSVWEDLYIVPDDPKWDGDVLCVTIDAFGDVNNPDHGTERAEYQKDMLKKRKDNEYWCSESEMYLRCVDFSKSELLEWAKIWITDQTGLPVEELNEVRSEELRSGYKTTQQKIIEGYECSNINDGSVVSENIQQFHDAIDADDLQLIRSIVSKGFDLNCFIHPQSSITALMLAILNDKEWIALYLIHKGADVNIADIDGDTPLHIAVGSEMKKVLVSLIVHGADINAKNSYGETPYDLAKISNNPKIIAILERMTETWGMKSVEKMYRSILSSYPGRESIQ